MKCIADMYTKDCLKNEKCCDDCDYENCNDGCQYYDLRDDGCTGCPYAVEETEVNMRTGRKIFATITVVDGKPVVDLGNTADYETVVTKDGVTFIVERKQQEYIPVD